MNDVLLSCIAIASIASISFSQGASSIQFYDSTGATATAKFGWSGDAATGNFFIETPNDANGLSIKDGNVTVDGNVTAGSFSGSGASLTNLGDQNIDSLSWSKIQGIPDDIADGDDVGTSQVIDSV